MRDDLDVANAVRPFWLPGINAVTGRPDSGLAEWVNRADYAIYTSIQPKSFVLNVSYRDRMLAAVAHDVSRMTGASFESCIYIGKADAFPKAVAWPLIRMYYAAFFAAHGILRILGCSLSQFGAGSMKTVQRIAILYGCAGAAAPEGGFYRCEYDDASSALTCTKAPSGAGGSHEQMWDVFATRMKRLGSDVLVGAAAGGLANQELAAKLLELWQNLTLGPGGGGSWLSGIRNRINYRHDLNAWHPYGEGQRYYDIVHTSEALWRACPLDIDLASSRSADDLARFSATCMFIVGLCRVLVTDVGARCPTGKSFLAFGPIRLLRQLNR